MSPKMTNVDIDLSMEDSPPGETEIVASSSSLLAGGDPQEVNWVYSNSHQQNFNYMKR